MPITVACWLALKPSVAGRNPRFPRTGEYGTVALTVITGTKPPVLNE